MTIFPGALTCVLPKFAYALPKFEYDVVRDIAIKTFYFSLAATAFIFVSILLTGIHP